MRTMHTWLMAASLMATVACGNNNMMMNGDTGPHDSGTMMDSMMNNDGGDAHPDTHVGPDVPPPNYLTGTCMMPVNLNMRGMALASGVGRTITGDNSMAPADPMADLVGPSCASDMATMMSFGGYAVVFSYTMQGNAALVATTDDPGTDPSLDTVLWIVDGCGTSAHELACNDDIDFAGGNAHSATSAGPLMAGTTVYIVVAGYTPPVDSNLNMGTFVLHVAEITPHAAGEMCDQTNPFCVAGYTCVPSMAGATSGTCNMNGTENAACNTTMPFCNTGLQCSVAMPTTSNTGVCQTPIADGMPCSNTHFVCVTGDTCIPDMGSTTMGHCIADGSAGGMCRMTMPECNTGLTCDMMTGLCH